MNSKTTLKEKNANNYLTHTKKNEGITLIVLIITIVVIVILASIIIVNISKSNIINNSNKAKIYSDIEAFKTDLSLNINDRFSDSLGTLDVNTINETGDGMKEYIPSIEGKKVYGILYTDILAIEKGKLVIRSNITIDEKLKDILENILNISITDDPVIEETKRPGFYDEEGNLVSNYESSGVDVAINYTEDNYYTSTTSMYCYLENNPNVVEVVLPNSITTIGDNSFRECINLTSITIPKSAVSIGKSAFCECIELTSITIPNSVVSIGEYAFYGCISLTSIVIDENNSVYDSRNNCNAIIQKSNNSLIVGCKSTIIPESVTSIGKSAFEGCEGLTSITIPKSVTSIGILAFGFCTSLENVTISDGLTSIGGSAFSGCSSLKNMIIPDSVTSIGGGAFAFCNHLTSITLSKNITRIEEWTFDHCVLTSITIPEGVTSIGESAFEEADITNITIPSSVTSIGDYAFMASSLTNVTIPSSVTSIGKGAFYDVDHIYYNGTATGSPWGALAIN